METTIPRDLDEALAAAAAAPEATILAGGTDLMVSVNLHGLRPAAVIAIRRIPELREWDGDFIGAGVTYRRLEAGPIPALAAAARTVGSPQIRSAGTIGGWGPSWSSSASKSSPGRASCSTIPRERLCAASSRTS